MIIRRLFKLVFRIALCLVIAVIGVCFVLASGYSNNNHESNHTHTHTVAAAQTTKPTTVKTPTIKLPEGPIVQYIEKMMSNYEKVKKAPIGTHVKCPVCGLEYEKEETDGYECCGRRCERAYRDIKNTYIDVKDGVATANELKELVEDYIEKLKPKK